MAMISKEEINNIRNSVDIVDIVSGYLPLTRKGKNYFGVCPFHDDNNPSMSVSQEKQIYTCFSCGATGNVFKFVMDYENVTFPEAIKIVASKAGIDTNINISKNNVVLKHQNLYDIYNIAFKFYHNNINTSSGSSAKAYLQSRQINDDIIKEFGIGLATTDRSLLTKLLINKKYNYKELLNSGLVINSSNGYNDIYYNRIMFPLWDTKGNVVGFSGRVYHGEDNYKYINTKETPIFKKGELLYNYHRAKDECRRTNVVIIMEGFMDVIRAYTIGYKNVIATMGTAITKEHALLIKKLAKDVILCFDGDAAGAKATNSCIEELGKVGVIPHIVRLEENLDPDEYILKYGQARFKTKIDNPISVMDFKMQEMKKDKNFASNEDLSKYVNDVLKELVNINDDILKELTLKKISDESNLNIDFLREKLDNMTEKKEVLPSNVIIAKPRKKINMNKYVVAERNLLYYMLKDPKVIKMYNKKITYMPTEKYRLLGREISYFYKVNGYINVADLISEIANNDELMEAISDVSMISLKDDYTIDEIDDYIRAIREYNVNYERERLTKKIKDSNDPIEKVQLAQKIVELKIREDKYERD